MSVRWSAWFVACGAVAVLGVPAAAQTAADSRPLRRAEVAVGGGMFGGSDLGGVDATLRANNPQPETYRLFATASRYAPAPALDIRVGTALSPRYGVEARVGFSRPELRTSISGDVEGVPALTVVERIDQYVIEGSLVVLFDELRLGPVVPFAAAGAGYLRQLHEGLTVIEHGHVYHVGGGVKHWWFARARGAIRAAGLRADARLYLLSGGYALSDGLRPHGAASAGVFVTF